MPHSPPRCRARQEAQGWTPETCCGAKHSPRSTVALRGRTAQPLGWHPVGQGALAPQRCGAGTHLFVCRVTKAALVAPPGPCAWVALFNVTPRSCNPLVQAVPLAMLPALLCLWGGFEQPCPSFPHGTAWHPLCQPSTRHGFAPARLGLGCGSRTLKLCGTKGDSACFVAVSKAGGGGWGGIPAAPAGFFSSPWGGESGQEIKGRPGPAGHCQELLGLGVRSGQRTAVRRSAVLRVHSRGGEGCGIRGTLILTRPCSSLLPSPAPWLIPPSPMSSPCPLNVLHGISWGGQG